MQLNCLGTVGYHPNDGRHTSCYFLPESGILLDAGTGVFRLAPLIQTDTLDVVLSHGHLDHTCGLTFLLDVLFERPVKKLTIWGEAEKIDAVQSHLFNDLIFPVALEAEWKAIDDLDEIPIGDVSISWRRQQHPGGSVGYRLDWPERQAKGQLVDGQSVDGQGKRLLYITDTVGDTSDEAIEWYRGADLLMHECYFQDDAKDFAVKTGHSWSSRVAEVTSAAKPKTLMLTHLNPLDQLLPDQAGNESGVELGKIRAAVDAEVILAKDGLVVDF